jgi:hypothetical protein
LLGETPSATPALGPKQGKEIEVRKDEQDIRKSVSGLARSKYACFRWETKMSILEGAGNIPQQAFQQWNDPQGNKLIALNRDGTISCQGIILPSNISPASDVVPVISERLQLLNTTTEQSVSLTPLTTDMVAISMYLSSAGTGASGHQLIVTINYTCELGPEVITVTLPLDSRTIIMETYPLLCIGGTTITLSTAYAGGATDDPYNLDVRLVQMP